MEIKAKSIRPIGFVTIEFDEVELQTIMSEFEDNCRIMNRPLDCMGGIRQKLYNQLSEVLLGK